MAVTETEVVAARTEQSKAAKRATLDLLKSKKRAEREVTVTIPGSEDPVSFLFRAISRREFDALVDECPPNKQGIAKGDVYDQDKLAPALLSRVVIEPKISEEDWRELWKSPDWSSGELGGLLVTAMGLCQSGFELVPTTGTD
jgi:hypothetical protein